nr:hypothetical protein [Tanacetum cinerariifolium]
MDMIICDLDKTPDLSQRPPQNCLECGNPVDGHYCQGCALLRNKFKEDLFTYCIENGILQYSSKPSNDNTNVVNALQEPFVVNQDPGKNSSRSPPQINHHCCYRCGDPLEDIFCHQCTCELCGRGSHYGYNFSPKVPVVFNPEPCHNQNVDELPQTLPSFDPTCHSEDGNSFTYDSTSNLIHDSPNFPDIHQLIREKTCAELLAEEHEANIYTQPFQYSVVLQPPQEEMSVEFLRERRNQMDSVKTFLRKFNRISFYEMPKVLSLVRETILEIELAFEDKHRQPDDILELFQRHQNDVQNIHEELGMYINTSNWDRPIVCYDDDDEEDYAIAVTPSLSTEEPDNSLSMEDEHLDTIPATESDEFIKSSVENLIPIPSESEGIPDNMCDVTFHDNSLPLNVSKDQFRDFFDSNDEFSSTDDDSFSIDNIDSGITTTRSDISTHFDSSLYDSFIFDLSINPFPPADRSDFYEFADELTHIISPPEYDCFFFKIKPNSGDFTIDVVEDISPTREPRVHNALPTHPTLQLNLEFILSSESFHLCFMDLSSFPLVFSCYTISSILRE